MRKKMMCFLILFLILNGCDTAPLEPREPAHTKNIEPPREDGRDIDQKIAAVLERIDKITADIDKRAKEHQQKKNNGSQSEIVRSQIEKNALETEKKIKKENGGKNEEDNDREKTVLLYQEAEKLLDEQYPFESSTALSDISAAYVKLNEPDKAKNASRRAERLLGEITDKKQHITATLHWAESLFITMVNVSNAPLAKRLQTIQAVLFRVSDLLKETPLPEESAKKDLLLKQLAKMQAWGTTLDEVQETIEKIENPEEKDKALSAVVEMLVATKQNDLAAKWVKKISSKGIRR